MICRGLGHFRIVEVFAREQFVLKRLLVYRRQMRIGVFVFLVVYELKSYHRAT